MANNKIEEITHITRMRTGKDIIKSQEDLKKCFVKKPVNAYIAESKGKPMLYRRSDLTQFAKAAFERGERLFYADPVDKNKPNGALQLAKPRYRYFLERSVSEEEFTAIFDEPTPKS